MPVSGESGEECHSRAYDARLDSSDASGHVPGGPQRTLLALSSAGGASSDTRRSTTGAFGQLGQHPIEFSCVALSSGEAELYATGRAAGGLQQLLAEAGMDLMLEVLTESTANLGMHKSESRASLKNVGTYSNVSDLTTKRHDEERLKVLMTLERLRHTRQRTRGRSPDGQ